MSTHRPGRALRGFALLLVLLAAVGATAAPSASLAAPGPTVTIRIEGENATLVPRTTVTTSTDPVPHGDNCPGNTIAGAIEAATRGNWDGKSFTQTIAGETHDFSRSDYWSSWLNDKVSNGICSETLNPGDDVLILVNFSGPPPDYPPTVFPLLLEGVPASVHRGQPFTVTAVEYRPDASGSPGTGTRTPASGVTVSGGGASATTGADGTATLSLPSSGNVSLQATAPRERSQTYPVCVSVPGDGTCGTAAAGAVPTAVPDTTGPLARIDGIRSGRRYRRGRAPRLFAGVVADPSGLRSVRLRLWRHYRGRCWFYSGASETLRRRSCGAKRDVVDLGDRGDWSYLLPFSLPPGHYRLDVIGVDRRGNRSGILPGVNRVDFYVR